MGSITPCCTSPKPELARALQWLGAGLLWLALAWCALAYGQATPAVTQMEIERDGTGLALSVSMDYTLPTLVEDALQKGIPMVFVAEAEVLSARWYWSDKTVASARRYMRLTYQPLTQRWRLNVSAAPLDPSGLGVSVGQTYDQLSEVLAAMQRISGWKLAAPDALDSKASYTVRFRFELDTSQLPRPLQIGTIGRSAWSLLLTRTERAPAAPVPPPAPVAITPPAQ